MLMMILVWVMYRQSLDIRRVTLKMGMVMIMVMMMMLYAVDDAGDDAADNDA